MPKASAAILSPSRRRRSRSWRQGLLLGGTALALQGALLAVAIFIGVMEPRPPAEERRAVPAGSPTLRKENSFARKQELARLSRLQEQGNSPLREAIAKVPMPDTAAALPAPDLASSVQAMGALLPMPPAFSADAAEMAMELREPVLDPPDPVDFLGEQLQAQRMVLLFDVSGSVKTKMERAGTSMEDLRVEVLRFLDQLGPNHLFGIIQFTRNWLPFREELVPATTTMKAEARDWMQNSFRTTGTSGRNWNGGPRNGIEAVLEAAFALSPQLDEVLLVSDGDFQRTPPGGGGQDVPWRELRGLSRELQQRSIGDARLRLLLFHPPEALLPQLRAWARENGPGSVRVRGG